MDQKSLETVQSKMLFTIDICGSKMTRNNVFDEFAIWRLTDKEMAIEIFVSIDFSSTLVDSIYVFDCRLSGVFNETQVNNPGPSWLLIYKNILLNNNDFSKNKVATLKHL